MLRYFDTNKVIVVVVKFTFHFVGSGSQASRGFELRPLSYLEHWIRFSF